MPEDMSGAPPEGGPRVHYLVHLTLKEPENAGQFIALAREMMTHTHREAGCVHYEYGRDCKNGNKFVVVEQYKSERDLWIHLHAPYSLRIIPEIMKLCKAELVSKCHPIE